MDKKDLEFILAYAECYGLRNKSVEQIINIIRHDTSISDFLLYYDVDVECYITDFIDAYKVIKMMGFEDECFTLMRSGYTIWMAIENWDLPRTAKEANEYLMQQELNDTLYSLKYLF